MTTKKTYSSGDIALGVLGALGLFAAAMKDAQAATENSGYVTTEKVKRTAKEIVEIFKDQAERDTTRLKWSRFDKINVEALEDLDEIEEDVKHMILSLAESASRTFNGSNEVKWSIMGCNYDVESSAIFNRLDASNITIRNSKDVYLVWLGLKIAKEQSTIIDDIDIF